MSAKSQYCLYLRKSRADLELENRGELETLARHERALIELAKKMNLPITKIYREVVSGDTIAARPVVQVLLSEIEQGIWSGVLVMEVERLARGDTIDQGIVARAFKIGDAKIITPVKVYDPNNEFDEEYFEFGLFMSRREYKIINRRLQRGRLQSVKEGKYVASTAPYGYKRVRLQPGPGFTLEPIPEEADVVRYIFDMFVYGEEGEDGTKNRLGCSLIARRLNERKIIPQKGDGWVPATIRDMIGNPIYIGMIRWNWRETKTSIEDGEVKKSRPKSEPGNWLLYEGLHPAIIDKETFDLAQKKEKKISPRKIEGVIKNPLAGIVVCSKCGRNMSRRPYAPPKVKADTLMCPAPHCSNVSVELAEVERRLLIALKEWAGQFKAKSAKVERDDQQIKIKKASLQTLNKELQTLETQLKNTFDLLEQGVYSVELFTERNAIISARRAECVRTIERLTSELESINTNEELEKSLVPKIENLLRIYHTIESPAEKNRYLKEILKKVEYTKDVDGRWHNDPYDFSLDLFPNLPEHHA